MTNSTAHKIPKEKRQALFLEQYAKVGIIGPAADASGVPYGTVKQWRNTDKEFKAKMDEAKEVAIDIAEAELRKRGVEGIDEPVLYRGEIVWKRDPNTGEVELDDDFQPIPLTIPRRSDKLLEVYMSAQRKDYRSKGGTSIEFGGEGYVPNEITIKFVDSDGEGKRADEDEEDFLK